MERLPIHTIQGLNCFESGCLAGKVVNGVRELHPEWAA